MLRAFRAARAVMNHRPGSAMSMASVTWLPLIVALFATEPALGQEYPTKVVRIVVSEAGGTGDFVARLLAQSLAPALGQGVVIDNRGGGVVAGEHVAKSAPDGHTLLLYGNTLWLLPLMRAQVPYDPARDFRPVILAAKAVNVLVVHPALPVRSVADLITLARRTPGQLNYASAAPGTVNHLAAELFKSMAQVDVVRVSFRGSASALTSVLSGQVHMMFAAAAGYAPHARSSRLRALAVTTGTRSAIYPDLPTMAEAGLKGFESVSFHGIFAPAKTADAIVARLNQEVGAILQRPEITQRLLSAAIEPVGGSPDQLTGAIRDEVARMGKLIREAGIREQ